MSTETKEAEAPIVKYDLTDAAIQKMQAEFMPLRIKGVDDKAGLASVHDARMTVKGKRVEVEKTRKELKADAIVWGKKVDAEAKRITAMLQPIEEHLRQEEDKVKAEKARIRAEAERKEEERLQFRVNLLQQLGRQITVVNIRAMSDEEFQIAYDQAKAEHEAEQARLAREEEDRREREEAERQEREAREEEDRKAREAEEARLAEQRAEQERVAEEQARKETALHEEREAAVAEQAEREAAIKAEEDRIAAERQAIENDKRIEAAKKEAAEQARLEEKAKAEREAAEKAEADRKAEEEAARQEALKPDKEKLWTYVLALSNLPAPKLKTKEAKAILAKAKDVLLDLAEVVKGSIEKM